MNEIAQGLRWWATLSYDEKAQWLQCEAGPDEIDEELESPDPGVRDAAAIAAVGDAWLAFKAAARASSAICQVCNARVPADLLLRHEATHSELEREIVRSNRQEIAQP